MNLRKEEEQRGEEERRETRAQCELGMEFNRQKTRLYLYCRRPPQRRTLFPRRMSHSTTVWREIPSEDNGRGKGGANANTNNGDEGGERLEGNGADEVEDGEGKRAITCTSSAAKAEANDRKLCRLVDFGFVFRSSHTHHRQQTNATSRSSRSIATNRRSSPCIRNPLLPLRMHRNRRKRQRRTRWR